MGLLQGLTEFLPVSSSGHLVIFQQILHISHQGVTLEVLVHLGTMLSVIIVFWKDITALFKGLAAGDREQKRLFFLLLAGTIVTGLMGIILEPILKGLFQNPVVTGFMLLLTGFIILAISRMSLYPNDREIMSLSLLDGLFIGLCQGIAVIPGISRSGATIFASLFRGMPRRLAIQFSFLLALPAIGGAAFIEAWDLFRVGGVTSYFSAYILAAVVAFITGIFAIKVFIKLLNDGKFRYFAYYCWFAGAFTVLYFLIF